MATPTSQVPNETGALGGLFESVAPHVHWLLRLSFAGTFIFHGITKFPQAAGLSEMMGMPVAMIYLLGTVELTAGLLALAGGVGPGILTRVAGLLVLPVMAGAIAMVHWPRWSFTATEAHPMGGMEFQVLLLVVGLILLVKGTEL